MPNPRLAARYAKPLLDLAVEKNCLEAVLKDMKLLQAICAKSYDFAVMLRSPVIHGDKKQAIISQVVAGYGVNELSLAFIKLLISKGREENLSEIADAFVGQYNELKHIKIVRLTTASAITDSVKEGISKRIAGALPGNTIDLQTHTDETLIGGFVIELGDKLFDASVKKSLNDIRTKVIDSSFVSKMN
jgi:F-type H+-transporting ATPase subunit delta